MQGIDALFSFYLDALNKQLATKLGYLPGFAHVQDGLRAIAAEMAAADSYSIPLGRARELLQAILPRERDDEGLLHHLLSEGVLQADLETRSGSQDTQVIRFTYQRLRDHEVMRARLATSLDLTHPAVAFDAARPLGRVLSQAEKFAGEVEALFVQLPERLNDELFDLVPAQLDDPDIRHAFLRSLNWRRAETISDRTFDLLVVCQQRTPADFSLGMSVLVSLATQPTHPFNADRLQGVLSGLTLAERDETWTLNLMTSGAPGNPFERLLSWAERASQELKVPDDVVRLGGIAVAWMLTSSNRRIRDRATRALVRLMETRVHLASDLLTRFYDSNDPYVAERVAAACSAAAMRTTDHANAESLARATFALVFAGGNPRPHLLLRDYARGIVEVAVHRGLALPDVGRIRPPYHSDWPGLKQFRTKAELEATYYPDWRTAPRGLSLLWNSIMGFEDFARYIIGTNHPFTSDWTDVPLSEPAPVAREQRIDEYVSGLGAEQQAAFAIYREAKRGDLMLELMRVTSSIREEQTGEGDQQEQEQRNAHPGSG